MKPRIVFSAAGLLLALYGWMASSVSDSMCTTGDEIAHLTAGYSYWTTSDYRLQPENGNLPQRWAALPLLGRHLVFPRQDQDAWRVSDVWAVGFQWFYTCGNDLALMLREGRAMIALFGVGLGALVFYWARRLHGNAAALLATGLFAFSPTMLANGGVITSDMCAAFMFVLAVTAFWLLAHRLNLARLVLFGISLGLLSVAKFSAPLVAPMCALLYGVRLTGRDALPLGWPFGAELRGRLRIALALGVATLAACALAIAVIWASYGFRYAMFKSYEPNRIRSLVGWDVLEDQGGALVPALRFIRTHHLLPESYVYGFAHTFRFSRYRKAFLNGDYRSTGWVQFFPYTTLVKTPLALFGLLALAGLAALARKRGTVPWKERLYAWSPLLSLFVVYWAFSLTSGLNIGHRHIIPIYPVLFVMASGATAWLARPLPWTGAVVAALAVWFGAESVWIRPHYLAYFNEIVGPEDAWRHLVDSSLDWGQDLPSVKRWLDLHPQSGPVYLSYFGSGDPLYYGIGATRVADANFDLRPRKAPAIVSGGLWIISVTQFQQVYTAARGPWDIAKEVRYRRLLDHVLALEKSGGHMNYRLASTFEEFQFARLCSSIKDRKPLAEPGYTFLIFKLTDEEVLRGLYGPPPLG